MKKKRIIFILIFLFIISGIIFAEKEKPDEKRLQFGFGIHIATPTINEMIQNNYRHRAIMKGWDYSYPNKNDEEMDDIQDLKNSKQRAILTKHILSSMEYGLHFRVLWRLLMVEVNQTLLPVNHYYDASTELTTSALVGVRAPFFVMPYVLIGPSLTVGFNIDNYLQEKGDYDEEDDEDDHEWKQAALNNTYVDFGLMLKTGLELKFKHFSFGLYYLYHAKSFDDFDYLYNEFVNSGYSRNEAIGNIIRNQSRFGLSLTWYFDGDRKEKKGERRRRREERRRERNDDDDDEKEENDDV